jgi:hypothetical protein
MQVSDDRFQAVRIPLTKYRGILEIMLKGERELFSGD